MNTKISSTNSNGKNNSAVRVYIDSKMVAEEIINVRNPLAYIRKHDGKYRKSMVEQCKSAGLSDKFINEELLDLK